MSVILLTTDGEKEHRRLLFRIVSSLAGFTGSYSECCFRGNYSVLFLVRYCVSSVIKVINSY